MKWPDLDYESPTAIQIHCEAGTVSRGTGVQAGARRGMKSPSGTICFRAASNTWDPLTCAVPTYILHSLSRGPREEPVLSSASVSEEQSSLKGMSTRVRPGFKSQLLQFRPV